MNLFIRLGIILLAVLSASGAFAANLEIDSAGNTSVQGSLSVSGTISGDGSGISNVDAASLGGISASGYVLQGQPDSITTGMLSDGAVTTGKVAAGAISPDNISFYSKVIIVAPSGGDFTSPVDAVNSITGNSSTNPYLIKIMPGIYDIGSNSVNMKSYVDIEGSGEDTTIIKGNVDSETSGVVNGANAYLRFLTVQNYGTGTWAIAVRTTTNLRMTEMEADVTGSAVNRAALYVNATSGSPVIMNKVTLSVYAASGGTNCYGIYNNYYFRLREGRVTSGCPSPATNYGVYNNTTTSHPYIRSSTVSVRNGATNYAFYNVNGDPKIEHSNVFGGAVTAAGGTVYIGSTRLSEAVIPGTGTLKCIGAYNSTFDALGTNCQ